MPPAVQDTFIIINIWGNAGWSLGKALWYYGIPIEEPERESAWIKKQSLLARQAGLENVEPFLRAQLKAFDAEQRFWAGRYAAGDRLAPINFAPSVAYERA